MVQGLLLGRLERRAWLTGHRLLDDGHFMVTIALDVDRVEPADLELVVEERVDQETIWSERLRLDDIDLRQVRDRSPIDLVLPSIGWGGVQREVRLHHRDGTLLDAWRPFLMLEAIHLTMRVAGPDGQDAGEQTTVIGRPGLEPELVELLGAVQRVKSEFAALRRSGLAARLIDDPDEARVALRHMLERASGEVLVMDPYLRDWALVENLPSGTARVLIGAGVDDPPAWVGVRVKKWRATSEHRIAPFHDRFFLWEAGGVAVGISAGGKGKRFFRFTRIDAIESAELRERFALWWDDPGVKVV